MGACMKSPHVKDATGRAIPTLVPGAGKPPGEAINPCFLWTIAAICSVANQKIRSLRQAGSVQRSENSRSGSGTYPARHFTRCRFLEDWKPFDPDSKTVVDASSGRSLADLSTGNYAFMIVGEPGFIHDLPEVTAYWSSRVEKHHDSFQGICLITGIQSQIARLHPAIKGVIDPGGQAEKGIVAINKDKTAFTSYGKEQSFNAPVSEEAAFAYCTALNYLLASERSPLSRGGRNHGFLDRTQPSAAEDLLPFLVDSTKSPEDEGLKQRLAVVLEKLADGKLATDDLGDSITPFYILGTVAECFTPFRPLLAHVHARRSSRETAKAPSRSRHRAPVGRDKLEEPRAEDPRHLRPCCDRLHGMRMEYRRCSAER